jgi:hypothetical protein
MITFGAEEDNCILCEHTFRAGKVSTAYYLVEHL